MTKQSLFSIFALLLCFVFTSCEEPYTAEESAPVPTQQEKTQKGNLMVSVFQLEQTPFSSMTRTAAADACTHLNFAVYGLDGTRIKQINQTLADSDFGKASFQLTEGTYRVVVVAHSSSTNPTMTDPGKIQFSNSTGYSDTFLCSGTVTIQDEPVNMKLTLECIVALCRFVITDDYPADVTRMRFQYTGGSNAFNAISSGFGCSSSTQTINYEVSTGLKQFDLYTFPLATEGELHLTVAALDANNQTVRERTFDVAITRNNITWLTGEFFKDSGSPANINEVNINTTWAGESHTTF